MSKTGVPEVAQAPATGLTSYLGAGKTALFNRIISENHDKRHAVVISGVSGLDVGNDLVIEADEEVSEMNSRSICCTVRVCGSRLRICIALFAVRGAVLSHA